MAVSRAANSDTFKVTTPSDREIRLTRLFDAPRQLVFDAMTKPEHVRRWWGCLERRITRSRCARSTCASGGAWRFVGRGPEGRLPGLLRRVSRDRAARPARLHRDLRAVPRRRVARDDGAHRGERQDAHHGHRRLPVAGGARHGASRPAWSAARRSATTGSRISSPSCSSSAIRCGLASRTPVHEHEPRRRGDTENRKAIMAP